MPSARIMAKRNIKNSLTLKNALFAAAIVLSVGLIWNSAKAVLRNYELQKELDTLRNEVGILQLKNKNLELNNQYYKTDAYLELAARKSLGLRAPGEKVIYVKEYVPPRGGAASEGGQPARGGQGQERGNFQSWMDFFLGRRQ